MGKQFEAHPDAQSRRQMLEQTHRRAGRQLQLTVVQNKAPQHAEQQASNDSTVPKGAIH